MTIKCSVFIATSLDGFIARRDGSIDWLERANQLVIPGEDCGYHSFIETVDILVMGRNTYEQVLTFSEWPYPEKKLIVLSSKGAHVPQLLTNKVSVTSESPQKLLERLSNSTIKHIYVDGGQTIQSFLNAGLIDEITITTIPILLGSGKPLFGSLKSDISLQHIFNKTYPFGFVQNKYKVLKNL